MLNILYTYGLDTPPTQNYFQRIYGGRWLGNHILFKCYLGIHRMPTSYGALLHLEIFVALLILRLFYFGLIDENKQEEFNGKITCGLFC